MDKMRYFPRLAVRVNKGIQGKVHLDFVQEGQFIFFSSSFDSYCVQLFHITSAYSKTGQIKHWYYREYFRAFFFSNNFILSSDGLWSF